MKNKRDIARRYDSSAEIYDNRYKDIQEKKYQEIFSRVELSDNETILDAGCGTGTFLGIINQAKDKNTHLVGIDISPEMIKIAHQKYPEIDFVVADSDKLPFRDNTFSKIFSVTHLQNLPEPKKSVKEMFRVARNKAKLAISILRKTWSLEKLEEVVSQSKLDIQDKWKAEVEDIGVVCTK